MTWQVIALDSLLRAATGGLIVLAVGSLAARLCRQPVRRARLVVLTLLAALIVPWLGTLPLAPRWPAGLLRPLVAIWPQSPTPKAPRTAVSDSVRTMPGSVGFIGKADPPSAGIAIATGPGVRRSAATTPTSSRFVPIPWRRLALLAYATASAGLLAWWLVGQAALWRVTRAARPVSAAVRSKLAAISGPAGRRVRLLESDRIDFPFTYTWVRPVILLPSALGADGDEKALRYCLAHEWSHVERRDAWTWNLAVLAGALLFYQPLFWWLRRQLRLCQDYLADDRAAALGSPEDYAAYLVRLASGRGRASGARLPALGIDDRASNLSRRVFMLVTDREPLERRCPMSWTLGAAILTVFALLIAAGFRLDAAAPGHDPKPAAEKAALAKVEVPMGETLHYSGKVKDKDSGNPVEGATVTVRRSILKPANNENPALQETKHQTDSNGAYEFTIPPEQAAEKSLYIELDVAHPDYATQAGFGYALVMIRKNEKLGGRPFFENIELRPGKPITGRVQTPDGEPAKGVKVLAYSLTATVAKGQFEYGSFDTSTTDDAGNFRAVLTTPGVAVFWILPTDAAPEMHAVPDGRRGDLGLFVLAKGNIVRGHVLDAQGKPVAGVFLNAERERDEATAVLGPLMVADAINRTAVTGAQGEFELAPLPAGTYKLQPGERARDGSHGRELRLLPAVFVPMNLTLKEGETPEPLEIRAAPHVVIEAQWLDSKGMPTWGFENHLLGKVDSGYWFGEARPTKDGKVVARVPHGMEHVQFGLMTNEHHAIKYRLSKDGPLRSARNIMLGTLNHDIKGIEIVHYNAPVLIVKAVTSDDKPVPGLQVSANYTEEENGPRKEGQLILAGGVYSDVNFEKQEDGRFRSEQLAPDREVNVTAQADGFKPAIRTFKLAEGQSEELTLVLEPK